MPTVVQQTAIGVESLAIDQQGGFDHQGHCGGDVIGLPQPASSARDEHRPPASNVRSAAARALRERGQHLRGDQANVIQVFHVEDLEVQPRDAELAEMEDLLHHLCGRASEPVL